MAAPAPQFLSRVLRTWTAFVVRQPLAVLLAFAALTVAAGWYSKDHLSIDTDTDAMLAADLPWRQAEIAYSKAFPEGNAGVVVLIDGETPEAAEAAQAALNAAILKAASPAIARTELPDREPFFESHGLLYLEPKDLDGVAADLSDAQPFFGRLGDDPSLSALFDLLGHVLTDPAAAGVDVAPILGPMAAAVRGANDAHPLPLSWEGMVGKGQMQAPTRSFLLVTPRDKAHEADAAQAVRAEIVKLRPEFPHAQLRMTGEVPLWMDELDAAQQGAVISAVAALLLGALFLYAGLRSVSLVGMCLVALIAGLVMTAGFAALVVGRLNLISVAFSTLYIGVAIDYGVQYALRFRELSAQGEDPAQALTDTGASFGAALVICALTTVAGFYAFVPTSYRGVAELGQIAGSGILIGLFTGLTLLPAMIRLWGAPAGAAAAAPKLPAAIEWLTGVPLRHVRGVRIAAVVLALIGLAALPFVRFDYNPMHLKPPHTESLEAYEALAAGSDSPLTAETLAPDAAAADALAKRFDALPTAGRVLTLNRFVAENQDQKLQTLEDLQLSIGASLPDHLELKPVDEARDAPPLAAFLKDADAAVAKGGANAKAIAELAAALRDWQKNLPAAGTPERAQAWTALRDNLLSGLPPLLVRLKHMLDAQPFTTADLPPSITTRWRAADGRYRVEISPKNNLNVDAELLKFVHDVESISPTVTGAPVDYVEGAHTVIGAFTQAFVSALVIIVVILLLLLRNVGDTLRALVPLVLGCLLLGAACAAFGLKLNFANVIALPLLLGLGVDIGVLIIWRARQVDGGAVNPVATATGVGVLVSVLATLSSFSSLMLSVHRGMASLGFLLTLGLAIYLACAFLVLPALLVRAPGRT